MRKKKRIFVVLVIIFIAIIGYGYSVFSSKEQECCVDTFFSESRQSDKILIKNTNKISLLKVEVSAKSNEDNADSVINVVVADSDLNEIKSFTMDSKEDFSKYVLVNSDKDFYVIVESDGFTGGIDVDNYSYKIL